MLQTTPRNRTLRVLILGLEINSCKPQDEDAADGRFLGVYQIRIPMPIKVQIPQAMRQHADNLPSVDVAGANVKEVLDNLGAKFPNIMARIFENGQLRRFVNLYLNDEDIRYLDNLQSPVKDGDVLSIIPAVAGG
jgi:sulfur-carrier protein